MNNQPTPVAVQQTTVIQVGSQKSVAGAVLLALFFGPLGMLYATVPGALVMFVISFVVAIATLGLGLLITLPICAIWAGIAASSHNKRLGVSSQHAVLAGQVAPAGWHQDPEGSGRLRYYDGVRWTDHYADAAAASGDAATTEPSPPAELEAVESSPPAELEPGPDSSEALTVVAEKASEQVFCGSCGAGLSPTARFCSTCGESQSVS